MSALDKQVGGNHYKKFAIQPAEFLWANEVPHREASAIERLMRWKDKGGIKDLRKAIHDIELLIEMETQGLEKLLPHEKLPSTTNYSYDEKAGEITVGFTHLPPIPDEEVE